MTKPGVRPTSKQVAQLGVWFLVFGLGVLMIEVWVGDHPFRGSPASWGLGEVFSVMGGAFLCRAAALRLRQQR
ncbi:hypothetical protein [Micromonospora sp. NPDC005707]|uniref:hypothetical protein n=1 Tax=Micromonospora sp. NPDC005707 TaxID=3157050 RepID=UPI0033E67883